MPDIYIDIAQKTAQVRGAPLIVCGNNDYTVHFTFDSEWAAYKKKTMQINFTRCGKLEFYEVLFEGNTAMLPAVYGVNDIEIGVIAGDIRTSTGARIECQHCITDGHPVHADPPQDVYNQLMEMLAGAQGGGDKPVVIAAAVSPTLTAEGDIIAVAEKEDDV